jgi:hypothetical protein
MLVTVLIPRALLKPEAPASARNAGALAALIDNPAGGQLSVSGTSEWMTAGLPSLLEASVEKVNRRKEYTELELRGANTGVKLRFAASVDQPEATLGQLIAEGGRSSRAARRYRDEAYSALADAFFPGELAALAPERKIAVLATLQAAAGSPDPYLHDNQLYASYDLGRDPSVFNDREADTAAIVAHVLNASVLEDVRGLVKTWPEVQEVRGIRVTYRIPHKSERKAATEEYGLEMVVTKDQLFAFASGELSAQGFVDASLLTVNQSPLRVALSGSED